MENNNLELLNGLFLIAKKHLVCFEEVIKIARKLASYNFSTQQILAQTEIALILARSSDLDAASSVETLTVAVNGFTREAVTIEGAINSLIEVNYNSAANYADLINVLSKAGAVAREANVSFNELLAITALLQQTTGLGGNVIGNGLKCIFTRIQREKNIDLLKSLGIQAIDKRLIKLLESLSFKFKDLNEMEKASICESLAGMHQANQLKIILSDLSSETSLYKQVLSTINSINKNDH